ncbi:MAG TPA: DMT family transporter [Vicinamibacterales bacterium]|nr:DMT family transporter [Vicinamibacterales bacterium]
MSARRWLDWILLVVPGTIWGASFLFIAEGLDALAPNGITFMRVAIGFACLACVPAARRPLAKGDAWPTAMLGVLWLALPLSLFPFAEQRVSSALTGMLNGATPITTALVAALLSRQWPERPIVAGLVTGVAGTVLIALPDLDGSSSAAGVAMIVVAISFYGVALNLARPLQQRSGALPVVWRALGVAVLLTAPLGIPAVLDAQWTTGALVSMLALGALGTCAANVLMTLAAGRLGATRASATLFLIPIVALLLGVIVRGERVALLSVAGAVVCLAGAALLRRRSSAPVHVSSQVPVRAAVSACDRSITVPLSEC